jgi:transglutaminase-like putative cysteine protease
MSEATFDAAFLAPTAFVDSDHPRIVARAKEICGDATTEAEKASRLFRAVREHPLYDPYTLTFERDAFRASAVLDAERSYCIPKAVLLAALARASGIGARLGFADVKNHLASKKLLEHLGTDLFSWHGYVELWIDGQPYKVTPAFNSTLCARFGVAPLDLDPAAPADALLQPMDGGGRQYMEYVADRGLHVDLPLADILACFQGLAERTAAAQTSTAPVHDEAFHG